MFQILVMLGRGIRGGITIMRKRKGEGQAIRDLISGGRNRGRRVELVVIMNLLVAKL